MNTINKEYPIKVDVFTLCYNEMDIIPFVIDYWKRFARHVYVFDNGSTDGSVEYLNEFGWISVMPFYSDGLNDARYLDIKNNAWKISDADFVVVCDMDECLYHEDIMGVLQYMKDNNQSISPTAFLNTVSIDFHEKPADGTLYHEIDGVRISNNVKLGDKCLLFNPRMISEISYEPGAHICHPAGNVLLYDRQNEDPIMTVHIKNLSLNKTLERLHMYRSRLSDINKINKWGGHYEYSDDKVKKDFIMNWQTSVDYKQIYDHFHNHNEEEKEVTSAETEVSSGET